MLVNHPVLTVLAVLALPLLLPSAAGAQESALATVVEEVAELEKRLDFTSPFTLAQSWKEISREIHAWSVNEKRRISELRNGLERARKTKTGRRCAGGRS
jgi:hypothetical protein